jgi:FkbM family methyltransferase
MSIVSYAQNFEDVMLWRALGHIDRGLYIDIGAQDPVVDSVSLAFHEHGWRGIHVEPTPHYAELLRQQRPGDKVIQAAVGSTKGILPFFEIPHTGISTADAAIADQHRERGFDIHEISVPCITLATVFKECQAQEIHWLKIDVEGLEEQVLRSWGAAKARPWIVVVESTLPLTQTESHESWEALLLERNYSAVYSDGLNRYYVSNAHPELKQAFAVPPNVFDEFKLNGTSSSTLHQLIETRHQSETSKTLEQHTRQRQDLQDEIERLSAGVAALGAAQEIHEAAWTARERELAAALQIANTQAEQEKVTLALEHEHHEHALHAEHTKQEAALTQRLQALDGERSALEQEYASRERTLLEQAEGASEKVAALLQTQAQREHQAQALAEDSRAHLAQLAQRENDLQAQVKIAQQQLRHEQATRARRAQNAAARLLAIYRQATKQKTELAEAYMAEKSQLQRSYAEQENLFKERLEASGLELLRLQRHAEALKEQHAEAAEKLRGQLEAAEKLHEKRALELTGLMLEGQQQSARENAEQARDFLLQERALQRQHADQQGLLTAQLKTAQSEIERLLKYQSDREAWHAAFKDELKAKSDSALFTHMNRERALAAQLLTSQQQAEKKKEEQALNHLEQQRELRFQLAERETQHAAIKDKLQAKFDSELDIQRQRERELTVQLLTHQQQSAKANEDHALKHLEQERGLRLQLAQLTDLSNTEVRTLNADLAERERLWEARKNSLFNDIQALQIEAQALKQSSDQTEQQHSNTLNAERTKHTRLLEAWSALEAQLREEITLEKLASLRLGQALEDVRRNLAATRATLTWRATAPLRKLASLLNLRAPPHLNPSPAKPPFDLPERARFVPPLAVLAEPSPATAKSTQSEPHMPLPEQTTPSSLPAVASTLPDLLARYDQDFVECAYRTLLGRAPDPEGFSYYLGRLRTGVPKMRTVTQLCESQEGKKYAAKLSGLDNAVRQFRRRERPVFGWFALQFDQREGTNSVDRQLRALENQLWLLSNATAQRFNQMERALAAVHQSIMHLPQSSSAAQEKRQDNTSKQAESAPTCSTLTDGARKLSPRGRAIYIQLKTAAALKAGRAT